MAAPAASPKRGRGRPPAENKAPPKPKKKDGRGRPPKVFSPAELAARAAREAEKKARGRGRPPKPADEKKKKVRVNL